MSVRRQLSLLLAALFASIFAPTMRLLAAGPPSPALAPPPTSAAIPWRLGDVNGDDRVDAADLLVVRSVLAGRLAEGAAPCGNPALGDFDLSGKLDAADAAELAAVLSGAVEPGAADRARFRDLAVRAAGDILRRAVHDEAGMRWPYIDENDVSSQPAGVYEGTAGIVLFLCALYREAPTEELRQALLESGRWLRAYAAEAEHAAETSLFSGQGGLGWTFLELEETLGDPGWRADALAAGEKVAAAATQNTGLDIFSGAAADGMFLLRLFAATGDTRWLAAARQAADRILAYGRPVGSGLKFPVATAGTFADTIYVGMAHGAAGMGYFFSQLARACPPEEAGAYRTAAGQVARWLRDIALARNGNVVSWYRREPDQKTVYQYQWCHGSPGIGLFFGELHRLTGDPADLGMARNCGEATLAMTNDHNMNCFCHGIAGNAELFLQLYRETNDPLWLSRARRFARLLWLKREEVDGQPQWESGDGSIGRNMSLWLGSAGVGHLFLALSAPERVRMPITE